MARDAGGPAISHETIIALSTSGASTTVGGSTYGDPIGAVGAVRPPSLPSAVHWRNVPRRQPTAKRPATGRLIDALWQKRPVLTLHERHSRLLIVRASKAAEPIASAMHDLLAVGTGDRQRRKPSLHDLGIQTFFLHAPWQKGGIENALDTCGGCCRARPGGDVCRALCQLIKVTRRARLSNPSRSIPQTNVALEM